MLKKSESSIRIQNKSYHVGLKCTPIKALRVKTGIVMIENGPEEEYSKRFKCRKSDKF